MSAADKSISKGIRRIKELSHSLNLKADVISRSNDMLKQISDKDTLKGKSIDARVATIIFMASRLEQQPKPIKAILAFTDCTQKELSKCYKALKE